MKNPETSPKDGAARRRHGARSGGDPQRKKPGAAGAKAAPWASYAYGGWARLVLIKIKLPVPVVFLFFMFWLCSFGRSYSFESWMKMVGTSTFGGEGWMKHGEINYIFQRKSLA